MAKSSTMNETKLPFILESLSSYAYKVGEIPFPPELIPRGDYNGVVKELKEEMKNYKIELVYLPRTDSDLLVYLAPLSLPSGFKATPFPVNVRKDRENDTEYYLNCGVEKNSKILGHIYRFDRGGDYQGMCEGNKNKMLHYVKELKELFEHGRYESINGIDAIRLIKVIEELTRTQLERSENLLRKHKFEGATFKTVSHYISGQKDFIGQWNIVNAHKELDSKSGDNYGLSVSYNYSDDNFVGSPNIISILLYSKSKILTSDGLKFLEEFSQLF